MKVLQEDFIYPEFTVSFENPMVKSLYVYEPDKDQLLQNYLSREGGELQHHRANVSVEYGNWLADTCEKLGIEVIEARPWNTAIDRIMI